MAHPATRRCMSDFIDRIGIERAWVGAVGLLTAVFGLGSVLFPRAVYANFVWQYFWGPVYADAHNWNCVAWADGAQVQPQSCGSVPASLGPVAEPGYTVVSEIGYALILLLMLVGVGLLVKRLRIQRYRALFYGLFPFMFFGGTLRVIEDVNDAARDTAGQAPVFEYPLNTLFISPVIYFTVFFVALAAVVVAVYLAENVVDREFEYPLFAIGATLLAANLLYFVWAAAAQPYVSFHPQVAAVVLVGATVVAGGVWYGIETLRPSINAGTGFMGAVVLWAHAVDGVANFVGLNLMPTLTGLSNLQGKHPVNRFIVDVAGQYLPAYLDAFPFLVVKMVAATFVLWVFDETVFDDSPRFTVMLLVAIVAVGLGPGTRDMVRATLYV